MSHSDDVSGAVVGISSQVAQKGVETAQHVVDKTIENIAKLIQALYAKSGSNKGKVPDVTSSDMTDVKSGEIGIKDLIADARKNGDTVVSTDGYSKADMKFISKKAAEYGIPVAFTNKDGADNICGHVRGSDKAIFERICTEMMQDKLKARPQELENFKAERWEIDGIQRELSKHDLNANWGKTKNGEYFCLFEKADKKAVLMARDQFVNKCNEVENDLTITTGDEYGQFTFKDEKSGNEIMFGDFPSKSELSKALQEKFGYDENKADIACCKYGEKYLDGTAKRDFFGNNPQKEFSKIENHVELKGESILVKDYDCLRVTPKDDGVPRLIYRDENNNFAILKPGIMTRAAMAETLRESLGIEDKDTINALVDKADKVDDYYFRQSSESFSHSVEFDNIDEIKKFDNVSENIENSTFIRKGNVENSIERLNKDEFKVTSNANVKVGKDEPTLNTAVLVLSFSDKKTALSELREMYKSQGLPDDVAKQSAKEVFSKAQTQSAEKVLQIEEIKVDKQSAEMYGTAKNSTLESVVTVNYGGRKEDFNTTDRDKAMTEISDRLGVSEKEAETLLDKAQEKIDAELRTVGADKQEKVITNAKKDTPINGHEKNPAEPIDLNVKDKKVDVPDKLELPKVAKRRK